MTACLSHCSRGRLSSRVLVRARRVPDWCKTRRLGCPMPVWGRGSGCQVAGSQRGTARRGLFSSAAPAAGPSPPQRTCCFHFFHEPPPLPVSHSLSLSHPASSARLGRLAASHRTSHTQSRCVFLPSSLPLSHTQTQTQPPTWLVRLAASHLTSNTLNFTAPSAGQADPRASEMPHATPLVRRPPISRTTPSPNSSALHPE